MAATHGAPRARTLRGGRAIGLGVAIATLGAGVANTASAVATPIAVGAAAIEEIVVSARRKAETLSDVPIAVTAFTGEQIEDAGIQRPEDFINLTP
ncbi:MAG: hypothetical protein AAGI15_07320, partial [Pseudomonadota bacterium]